MIVANIGLSLDRTVDWMASIVPEVESFGHTMIEYNGFLDPQTDLVISWSDSQMHHLNQ